MKTQQEIFTQVVTHLLKQNEKSMAVQGIRMACAYRGQNGTSCAVGCLIPDSKYLHVLEGQSAVSPQLRDVLTRLGYIDDNQVTLQGGAQPRSNLALLQDLQLVHDSNSPHEWPALLKRVATEYQLEMP